METLLEAFSNIVGMIHWVTDAIASPTGLPPAELYAATGALILNVASLALLRALTDPRPVEKAEATEYDEAA